MAADRGQDPPEFILNKPVLDQWMLYYFNAWRELTTCRSGWGQGPIPWTAIDAYSRRYNIEEEDFRFFLHMIRTIDNIYLKLTKDKDGGSNTPTVQQKGPSNR